MNDGASVEIMSSDVGFVTAPIPPPVDSNTT